MPIFFIDNEFVVSRQFYLSLSCLDLLVFAMTVGVALSRVAVNANTMALLVIAGTNLVVGVVAGLALVKYIQVSDFRTGLHKRYSRYRTACSYCQCAAVAGNFVVLLVHIGQSKDPGRISEEFQLAMGLGVYYALSGFCSYMLHYSMFMHQNG